MEIQSKTFQVICLKCGSEDIELVGQYFKCSKCQHIETINETTRVI